MENITKTEKGIGFLERILELTTKYPFINFIKSLAIIFLTAVVIGFISNPEWIFEKFREWDDQQHQIKIEMRMKNNEKLHILSEKLLYKVNAQRVLILELHNGNANNAGIPFSKCSATYEALNTNVLPVADQYQEVNLSLIPFAYTLIKEGYWFGDVDTLESIDKSLYYKMKSNGTEHFAAYVIKGVDKPLAFVFVSFTSLNDNHNCLEVKENIYNMGLNIALLLELNKQ
jgi:hypothetical protein